MTDHTEATQRLESHMGGLSPDIFTAPGDAAKAFRTNVAPLRLYLATIDAAYQEHGENWADHLEPGAYDNGELAGLPLVIAHQAINCGLALADVADGAQRMLREMHTERDAVRVKAARVKAAAPSFDLDQELSRFEDRVQPLFMLASLTLEAGGGLVAAARPMTIPTANAVLAIKEEWDGLLRKLVLDAEAREAAGGAQ